MKKANWRDFARRITCQRLSNDQMGYTLYNCRKSVFLVVFRKHCVVFHKYCVVFRELFVVFQEYVVVFADMGHRKS